jgi:iron complex outermembrane receptor protein
MLKAEQLANYNLNAVLNFSGGATYEYFNSIPRGHDLEYPIFNRTQKPIIIGSIQPNNPSGIEAPVYQVEYSNIGGFLQTPITPSEPLAITLGARYDYNTRYGGSFNPRAGIVYEINKNFTTKLLYGSAFLAPSPLFAFEEFGSFVSFDGGNNYVSFFFRLRNPNLKPQTIQTFESSTTFTDNKNFRVNLNAFYSISEGLFNYGPDADNENLYNGQFQGYPVFFIETALNTGKQTSFGGSVQIDFRKNFGKNNHLNAYLSASYVSGKSIEKDSSDRDVKIDLPAISPWIFKAGFDLEVGRFSLSPRLIYLDKQFTYTKSQREQGRQQIDGYLLGNLQINYRVTSFFNIFAQFRNLFDQRYYSLNLGAAPEQATQGAAQVEFANGAPQNPIRIMGGFNVKF